MDIETDNIAAKTDQKLDRRPQAPKPALIELRDVFKIYESAAGKYPALNGVNLRIDVGEFVAVIGKSGSGKTTLMNMITGIDKPTLGEVVIGGTGIHSLNEGQTAIWRGSTVGVVFQFFQLLPTLTVIENVMLPMDFCHRYSIRERHRRALYLLDQVELVEYANRLPSALSGGQQQRVAIARALANDPPILIADEPTGNLDSATAAAVFQLFEKLVRQGKTIVMVTHDQDLVKQVVRTIFIKDGRITGDQTRAFVPLAPKPVEPAPAPTPADAQPDLHQMVSAILDEQPDPAQKLRELLTQAPRDRQQREALYQVIFEEIKTRADLAEQTGKAEDSRKFWGILVDATGK